MKKSILLYLSSLSIGFLIGRKSKKPKLEYVGVLRIDNSEKDEPPKLFLELEKDVITVSKSNTVHLKVLKKDYL